MEIIDYTTKDMIIRYIHDSQTSTLGFTLIPKDAIDDVVAHRETLDDLPEIKAIAGRLGAFPAWRVDSCVQIKCIGDAYPGGFGQGRTMRRSETVDLLTYKSQWVDRTDLGFDIVSELAHPSGWVVHHHCLYQNETDYVTVWTELHNTSKQTVETELLSAFSMSFMTPFSSESSHESLYLHRFRSNWSAEGRHDVSLFEDLHLERSWSGHSANTLRFGRVGSMPVREFFLGRLLRIANNLCSGLCS